MYNVLLSNILYQISEPVVMGIVNVSSDSFYESATKDADIIALVKRHISEGAKVIDIGGCSTRPSSEYVSEKVELERVRHALELIRAQFADIALSVDTFRTSVARMAVEEYGVSVVNDISGGHFDNRMYEAVGSLGVGYVLTYFASELSDKRGDEYIAEVIDFFQGRIYELKQCGVKDIILDPGFGFGKSLEQNYLLLSRLADLRIFGLPILAGVSHKSMIYRVLGTDANGAGYGSTVAEFVAMQNGADIIRTHNVKSVSDGLKLLRKINTL